jgi:dipeptidyl aminopeptidase/acylaminoacyl peptidase
VFRQAIEPHWFSAHTRFWYRVDVDDHAYEFVLVDAKAGTRQPAFDHIRLAAALSKVLGWEVPSKQLPIDDLDLTTDPAAMFIVVGETRWRLDPVSYSLTSPQHATTVSATSLLAEANPHPSRKGGRDTSVVFQNRTAAAVEVYWIDENGKRDHYATIQTGGEWASHTYDGHVWLVTDKQGRTLAVFEATATHATALIDGKPPKPRPEKQSRKRTGDTSRSLRHGPQSPDGTWVAFIKDHNVYLCEKANGKEVALSRDGKAQDSYGDEFWWSPDSQNLVAMRIVPGEEHKIYTVESSPEDQLQPKLRTLDYPKPGDRIEHKRPQLFHVKANQQIVLSDELYPNPWSIEDVRWSADSSRFTFVYNQRGHQVLRVIAIDASTGSARPIVDEHSDTFIDYSGKYFCQWIGDKEFIWMSERDGWNHLWLYDTQTGKPKNCITAGDWVVQRVVHVDEQARQIWFDAGGIRPRQDPYYTQFCRVNFDSSGLTILTEGDGQHVVQWSAGEPYFIDRWSRVDLAPISELRDSNTGKLVCKLEEADARQILDARGGHWPIPFAATGRDGATDIYGMIVLPRDFDPARKYPVVEDIYAGPQAFYTPKGFRARYGTLQKIADRGMIVVQCDGMGTSGRSKKFHDVCWKNLRDAGFPDRIAWIKAAAEKFPQMDLGRVGIFGGSAGGQNAMAALLWQNDFYRVAVADCGCHDNRMDKIWWNEQWMGWPVGPEYAADSNAVNAHLLRGKLMLIVGEMDDNVDPSSTLQVVNALEKADKDFQLVVVTGAHHGAAETPYGSRKRLEFLTQNLLGP